MNPFTRFYLLRHGEVETAYQRVFAGRLDVGLSPTGARQAEILAHSLRPVPFDAVYVSPLRRAQATAKPLLASNGHRAETITDLQEMDFGDWTGHTWDEVLAHFGKSAFDWLEEIEHGRVPNGETGAGILDRLGRVLTALHDRHRGRTVAVICHGGVIRAALAWWLGLPLARTGGFEIDYASVTIVDWHERRPEVQLLNWTPWRNPQETDPKAGPAGS